jgi:hypothetical protein
MEIPTTLELRIEEGAQYRTLDALSLVKAYVHEYTEGPSLAHDGVLRYMARLAVIKDNLVFLPDEDRLQAFVWLINEKQDAEDNEEYERALILKECQTVLEDRLHNLKNTQFYVILEEFFDSEKVSPDYMSRAFEKSVITHLTINEMNGYKVADLNNPLLQVAIFAGLIKSQKQEIKDRFEDYYNSRDEFTKSRQKLGLRRNN